MLEAGDTNKDGKISFEEFRDMIGKWLDFLKENIKLDISNFDDNFNANNTNYIYIYSSLL